MARKQRRVEPCGYSLHLDEINQVLTIQTTARDEDHMRPLSEIRVCGSLFCGMPTHRYVPERTTTRDGKHKTKYGRWVPLCEICGYSIGDSRYNFCPKCGARIVETEAIE